MKLQTILSSALVCGMILSCAENWGCAQELPSSAGSLDTGFFPGTSVVPGWNGAPTIRRIVVQPDGRVLICGGFDYVQHYIRHGLARFESNGTFDSSFVPAVDFIQDVALEPGGKIVVAGTYRGLARLNADGTLDPSFDGQVADGATAVARLGSGEFLAGIHIDNDPLDSTPRYGVVLFDAQGHSSTRWSSAYRSPRPVTFILVAPTGDRVIVDGPVELSLQNSENNFRWLTNALPSDFRTLCGLFQNDGKLLLGSSWISPGEFTTNATLAPALLRLNPDGSPEPSFSTNVSIGMGELEGGREQLRVAALAEEPDGKLIIGGFFTRVKGEPRSIVARLFGDGRLDSTFVPDIQVNPGWDIDAQQCVSAMALTSEGKLLTGGVFYRCNGIECHSLVRLHTAGDTGGGILSFAQNTYYTWETNGPLEVAVLRSGASNTTVSVAYETPYVSPNTPEPNANRGILVFGPGETRKMIALEIRDNLLAEGNRSYQMVLSNPTGGAVLTGTPETRIVILDDETCGRPGSVDLAFPALTLGEHVYNVTLLAVEADGSALLSLMRTIDLSGGRPDLLRIGPTGQIDPDFHPATDEAVSFAFPYAVSGKILIVGGFTTVNGQSRAHVARLNHDGSLDLAYNATVDGWINGATVQPDGKLVLFGYFNSVNQVPCHELAQLNVNGSVDAAFDASQFNRIGNLFCVASQGDGKIVIAGYFDTVNGVSRTNLARLNNDASVDTSFVADSTGYGSSIRGLLFQPDGKLLVSGTLRLPDGRATDVVRLHEDGSRDTSFTAPSPGLVEPWPLLLQPDGKIIVGGKWRLNSDGSRDYSFFTGADPASVSGAALLPNGDLLVSGGFSIFAEWPRPYLVRLHGGSAPVYGFFEFTDSYTYVREDAAIATVGIRRVGPADQEATVEISTCDASARENVDYSPFRGTLSFAPGVMEQTVAIPIINRMGYQGSRLFQVQLQDRTAGIRAPSEPLTTVFIYETEPGLTFSQTNYWVSTDDIGTNGTGALVATLLRRGPVTEAVTVQCQLAAGTAVAGQDFIATNLTLFFQPQQSELFIIAPLLRNDSAVADRTVFLVLNHADPGWSLATDSTAVLTIIGKRSLAGFVPGSAALDTNGCMRVLCDIPLSVFINVESSTDLLNWTYLRWLYRETLAGPVVFEDPDAWKYSHRFYRIPLSQSGPY